MESVMVALAFVAGVVKMHDVVPETGSCVRPSAS